MGSHAVMLAWFERPVYGRRKASFDTETRKVSILNPQNTRKTRKMPSAKLRKNAEGASA
jgi:hypothetical protein